MEGPAPTLAARESHGAPSPTDKSGGGGRRCIQLHREKISSSHFQSKH